MVTITDKLCSNSYSYITARVEKPDYVSNFSLSKELRIGHHAVMITTQSPEHQAVEHVEYIKKTQCLF